MSHTLQSHPLCQKEIRGSGPCGAERGPCSLGAGGEEMWLSSVTGHPRHHWGQGQHWGLGTYNRGRRDGV